MELMCLFREREREREVLALIISHSFGRNVTVGLLMEGRKGISPDVVMNEEMSLWSRSIGDEEKRWGAAFE